MKQAQRPAVRRSLRIAQTASAAALAAAMILPYAGKIEAKRQHWHEYYEFTEPQTAAQIEQDLATLGTGLVSDLQSCTADGYTITMTGYATDGLYGFAYFDVTVPEGFDWAHPYLLAEGAQYLSGERESGSVSLGGITALTPTDTANVYRCESAWQVSVADRSEIAAPKIREIVFDRIQLRDEAEDFDEAGRYVRGNNPHTIVFDANFTLSTAPTAESITEEDVFFGTRRITPFAVYLYSFDVPEIARNYERISPFVPIAVLTDGTRYDADCCWSCLTSVNTNDYTEEEIEIMEARGEAWESNPWYGFSELQFQHPVRPEEVAEVGTEAYISSPN